MLLLEDYIHLTILLSLEDYTEFSKMTRREDCGRRGLAEVEEGIMGINSNGENKLKVDKKKEKKGGRSR